MDFTVESRLSFTAGVMVFLLGAVVMIGWHAQLPALVKFPPTFYMMRYNAALGFSLLGFGLVAANLTYRGLSKILGGLAGLLGMLTLLEYLFSTDLGIDELFMPDYFQANTEKPGSMSPIAASCLAITGIALIIANHVSGFQQRLLVVGILCATFYFTLSKGGVI